jgi:hypothetical protein
MSDHEEARRLEGVILTRLLRLDAWVHGVVVGLVAGAVIFVVTNWLVLKGGPVVGPHLALLGQVFPGYRVTFAGSLIGLAYGFAAGFALGYFVARVYNWLIDRRESTLTRRR